MVCKENVVSWFGNLTSFKRIDVMVTLLNMCLPFEVRYLGTCIEDRGKRDYNDLRDTEHHANNISDLTEVTNIGIKDTRARRKLILYIALLNSCNYQCATLLDKSLSNYDHQEITNLLSNNHDDQQLLEELLLLYTMAINHPAFTYEQKTTFGNIYLKLQEEEAKLHQQKPTNTQNKSSERPDSIEITVNNCPPIHHQQPQQHYSGDVHMRNNQIPPGLTIPPPGLGLPNSELPINIANNPGQYLHMGFPAVNSVAPWQTQNVMVGNQFMYHNSAGDMLATYPVSPLVSRQSSPSQSRSPSRSNSPMGRRNNSSRWTITTSSPSTTSSSMSFDERNNLQQQQQSAQINQSSPLSSSSSSSSSPSSCSSSTSTTTSSSSSNALSISGNNNVANQSNNCTGTVYQTSSSTSIGGNRNNLHQNQLTRTAPPPPPPPLLNNSYLRHNNLDNSASGGGLSTKHPPPPRLRSSVSSDTLRETLGKEMPNFKGNLRNYSLDEIRRMSDDDLQEIGLPPNAVGQLRNIVRGQITTNGVNQIGVDKKLENSCNSIHTTVTEQSENETGQIGESDNINPNSKVSPPIQDIHPPPPHHHHHHHHHHHNNNNNNTNSNNHPVNPGNIRRYPTLPPPVDPTQIQIYHPPPTPMYATQNPCYACLTVPIAGMQNRYPRCSAQHMYCVAQLSALKLDSDNSRHYSQSSSSDSTGSRSPPETPPAAPWTNATNNSSTISIDNNCPAVGTIGLNDHNNATSSSNSGSLNSISHYSTVTAASHQNTLSSSQQQQQQQINERPRRTGKHHGHMMRHKNQLMNGGGGNGPPPNLSHCISAFPVPTSHQQMTFLPQSHFTALRGPNSGLYSSGYPHSIYTRPTFQPNYQQNGEIIYSYTGQPGGGTPPPPPPPPPVSVAAIGVGLPSQSYMTTTQTVNYTPATVQQQTKLSCYNCGSSSHLAIDCKDQSMEDLTKRAQYRLDFTMMKPPGDCPSNDE
ncbi:hypothetical protein PV325_011805 [Microctonus aethiopoides]|uniref:CCHC-type domain-containing protein n=1 Tax=Microctonus aethiopoides TaxID=144406 RepID=A0AA39F0P7_9HYME|nr:hypothetical protein PV325_011805 [Microctonus aethiopoides]KAK0160096.1 hypothetical protein PV328_007538 [Microctonus aethiopoides]